MLLDQKPLSDLIEKDLKDLKENGVPEGEQIDYKQAAVGQTDGNKLNFLKDVSAFANAQGGNIVFGIEESGGVPTAISGLIDVDPDAEIIRLDSMISAGIQPRIFGVGIVGVPLGSGDNAIVVRVPRSWAGPHMVVFQKHNRFWIRRSNGNDMMTVDEVRDGFMRGQEVVERIRRFRQKRIEAVMQETPNAPIQLSLDGELVVHLVPFSSMNPGNYVDIRRVHPQEFLITPLQTTMSECRYNADGLLISRSGGNSPTYLQVYRNGIFEAVLSGIVYESQQGGAVLAGGVLDRELSGKLLHYLNALYEQLDVVPPIAVFLSLLRCKGAEIDMSPRFSSFEQTPIDRSIVDPPEVVLYSYDDNLMTILRPALDAIWNAAGWEASPYFNGHGNFQRDL